MQDHTNFLSCTHCSRKLLKRVIQEKKKKKHEIPGNRGTQEALGDEHEAELESERLRLV